MSIGLNARLALAKHGFHFTHSLGQNFLLDDEWIGRIVDAAGVTAGDNVLEIGAGAGVLTAALAARGAGVLALEIDRSLEPVLRDVLAGLNGVRVEYADALKCDLAALTREAFGGAPFVVCANLPYYITADAVLRVLRCGLPVKRATVLVQKEAAERMMAAPGEKAWCALAATVQFYARPVACFDVPPAAFTPPPHVTSRLLRLEIFAQRPVQVKNEQAFLRLIAAAFAMRRKTLLNNLMSAYAIPREGVQEILSKCGLDERVRGEALSLLQLGALADAIWEFTYCS